VEDLADAIVGLASNPARRRAMAGAARGYALSRGWERALAPLYGAYRNLAVRRRAGGVVPPRANCAAAMPPS
jgi:hypothetical protein